MSPRFSIHPELKKKNKKNKTVSSTQIVPPGVTLGVRLAVFVTLSNLMQTHYHLYLATWIQVLSVRNTRWQMFSKMFSFHSFLCSFALNNHCHQTGGALNREACLFVCLLLSYERVLVLGKHCTLLLWINYSDPGLLFLLYRLLCWGADILNMGGTAFLLTFGWWFNGKTFGTHFFSKFCLLLCNQDGMLCLS